MVEFVSPVRQSHKRGATREALRYSRERFVAREDDRWGDGLNSASARQSMRASGVRCHVIVDNVICDDGEFLLLSANTSCPAHFGRGCEVVRDNRWTAKTRLRAFLGEPTAPRTNRASWKRGDGDLNQLHRSRCEATIVPIEVRAAGSRAGRREAQDLGWLNGLAHA